MDQVWGQGEERACDRRGGSRGEFGVVPVNGG